MAAFSPSLLLFLGLVSTVRGYLHIYPPVDENDTRTPLYFALLQSFGSEYNGSGSVAGLQVALDRINSDPTLLPGYSLHYTLTDSQCNRTVALNALLNQIIPGPVKIAVIGSGCSVATEATADISHYFNITHISCVSSSTGLANRVKFRYYFQLVPTEASIAPAYFGVIRQYEWRRVGLIVQNENLFTVTMSHLKQMLDTINVTYEERIFESEDGIAGLGPDPFSHQKDPSIRIHIIATYAVHARPLLCEAYQRGLHYLRHLFLTYGWYVQEWWRVEDQNLSCTAQERENVINRALAFLQFEFIEEQDMTTSTGINGGQYFKEERNHVDVPPLYLEQSDYAQYCYDATWTLVYALNQTINELEENSTLNSKVWEAAGLRSIGTFPLDYFSYNNSALLDVIFRHLEKTNFSGVTGPVSFSDMGIRPVNRLQVMQYRYVTVNGSTKLRKVNIAKVGREEGHQFQYLPGESNDTVWPGGAIPYDGVPTEKEVSVDLSLTVIFSILATAGIVFAVACLVFNFLFRNKKLIRLSSPDLNYIIGVGAIILYVDIYLFIIPTTDHQVVTVLCNSTPWLIALGYSLCYGTILAKMVRIYYIFGNPTPQKKILKDWHLALGVLLLVLIDLTILLVYTTVEGVKGNLTATRVRNRENPRVELGEVGIIAEYFKYVCSSQGRNIFLSILYGYKLVLQVIILAFTSLKVKVKIKGLNDAKYVAAATSVTSIVLTVILLTTYTLKDFVNVFPAVICTGLFIGTTSILGLVFVPKMVGLYQDPEGKTVFLRTDHSCLTTNSLVSDRDTIESLRKQVQELKNELVSDKGIIESLRRRVQEHKNEVCDITSLSKPRAQSITNTHVDEGLGGEGGYKEGKEFPTV